MVSVFLDLTSREGSEVVSGVEVLETLPDSILLFSLTRLSEPEEFELRIDGDSELLDSIGEDERPCVLLDSRRVFGSELLLVLGVDVLL